MDEDAHAILICMTVVDGVTHPHYLATVGTCASCGCRVWLTPSSHRLIEDRAAEPVCDMCGHVVTTAFADLPLQFPPGATDELEDVGGPDLKNRNIREIEEANRRRHRRFS